MCVCRCVKNAMKSLHDKSFGISGPNMSFIERFLLYAVKTTCYVFMSTSPIV